MCESNPDGSSRSGPNNGTGRDSRSGGNISSRGNISPGGAADHRPCRQSSDR